MMQGPPTYPATLTLDAPLKVANWRPIVQWILAIPHYVILYVLQIAVNIVALISWFAILITGDMPEGLAGFQTMYIRYAIRTYSYVEFMHESYPPFVFDTTAADPGQVPGVRVDVQPQLTGRNRLTVFFRLILAIPQVIVLAVLGFVAGLASIVGFFAVLFTGKWPAGLRAFVVGVLRWWTRLEAYFLLLTDVYPPFSLD